MKLVYKRRALSDLESINAYIARESPATAKRVTERILRTIARAQRFPYSGRAGAKPGTREAAVPGLPYLLIYRVLESGSEGTVEAVAVYHTARNREAEDYA